MKLEPEMAKRAKSDLVRWSRMNSFLGTKPESDVAGCMMNVMDDQDGWQYRQDNWHGYPLTKLKQVGKRQVNGWQKVQMKTMGR